jgi:DNA-binding MarR family transcriptional regulator
VTTYFDSSPSYLIAALGNRLSVLAARNVRRQLGLSLMEWRALALLAVEPGATPGRIVDFSAVNKSVVSRAVNALLKRGLITRAAAPDHGLRTHLFLTAEGQAMHDAGVGARLKAEETLLNGLPATERERLVKVLKQLMGNLEGA